mmetsp:Transcript_72792/g.115637  ORF Transcript_72792/g.115637 Transcript_72792/m.115637 type:complete len:241 (+) Transcript_72792:89-811(+)
MAALVLLVLWWRHTHLSGANHSCILRHQASCALGHVLRAHTTAAHAFAAHPHSHGRTHTFAHWTSRHRSHTAFAKAWAWTHSWTHTSHTAHTTETSRWPHAHTSHAAGHAHSTHSFATWHATFAAKSTHWLHATQATWRLVASSHGRSLVFDPTLHMGLGTFSGSRISCCDDHCFSASWLHHRIHVDLCTSVCSHLFDGGSCRTYDLADQMARHDDRLVHIALSRSRSWCRIHRHQGLTT